MLVINILGAWYAQPSTPVNSPLASEAAVIELLSWHPRVFRYRNFLTEEECDHLTDLASTLGVARSEVVAGEGDTAVNEARTSSGVFLTGAAGQDPVVKKVAQKIATWTQLPEQNGEAFYIIKYEKDQQYLPHHDWFSADSDSASFIGDEGQRIATVLTYLSTPKAGGETIFPEAKGGPVTSPAKKGDAVLFWNVSPDGVEDVLSLHQGRPVIEGVKWAMTRWIRAKKAVDLQ